MELSIYKGNGELSWFPYRVAKVLSEKELSRYSRQIVFPFLGKKGQERLKESKVSVLGLGGVGCAASLYLAAAGVNLRLIDRDLVELNNLQRQILYSEEDVGKPKALAAKQSLEGKNSDIEIEAVIEDFNPSTAENLVRDVDLVVDGTDNFEARYLLNDVCVKQGVPFFYGAAIGAKGVLTFISPGETACFTCIFPNPPKPGSIETCEVAGVMGPSPGVVGVLEAVESIKYLAGFGSNLKNRLIYLDLLEASFDEIRVLRNKNCRTCVKREFIFLERREKGKYVTSLCGLNAYQVSPTINLKLNLADFSKKISRNPDVRVQEASNEILKLLFEGKEVVVFKSGRIIVKNVGSEERAVSIASRIIGF